jgi:hypothetical protein
MPAVDPATIEVVFGRRIRAHGPHMLEGIVRDIGIPIDRAGRMIELMTKIVFRNEGTVPRISKRTK